MAGLTITVHGTPVPQGSMIKNRYGAMYSDNAKVLKPWRKKVTAAAVAAIDEHGAWVTLTGPVAVTATFTYVRPASHYRTGRYAHILRDDAVPAPIKRGIGDVDKCIRACLDALTDAGVWADDVQVCTVHADKAYGTTEGVVLTITADDEPATVDGLFLEEAGVS